jgi:hypothetical protein
VRGGAARYPASIDFFNASIDNATGVKEDMP